MQRLHFHLTRSSRACCRGHTDTYEIEGADEASQEWLGDWTLYCDTCKALTLDYGELQYQRTQSRDEDVIGFITQVPISMRIVK